MAASCSVEEVSGLDGLGFAREDVPICLGDPNIFSLINDPENAIQRITLETAWTPPLVMDKPFAGPSTVTPLERLLKPKFTIDFAVGSPLVVAPAGYPGESKWPLLAIPAALLLGGAGVLLVMGVLRAIAGSGGQ